MGDPETLKARSSNPHPVAQNATRISQAAGKLAGLLGLGQQLPPAIEARFPERTTVGNPALGHGEAFRFDATGSRPANFFGAYQPALFEYLQVLNHSSQSDIERFGQPGHGDRAFTQ